MNSALVISQTPGSKEIIRSDMVAAKVLQKAIKEGRGKDVLSPRSNDPSSSGVAHVEPTSVGAPEQEAAAEEVRKNAPSGLIGSSKITEIREKISDTTRSLASLKEAFEAMSGYNTMIMESDSATAIAYAGNVLGYVERVLSESGKEGTGGIGGTGGPDTLTGALDPIDSSETAAEGDDNNDVVDHVQVSGGDEVYYLDVGRAKMSLQQGMGQDVVDLTSGAHMQFARGDTAPIEAGAEWDGDTLSLSFKNGDSLVINNAANAGSISLRSGDTLLILMPPKLAAEDGILDVAV